MDIATVNPSGIPSWDSELQEHGDHSFFHTAEWSRVLESTYGYKPVFFTIHQGRNLLLMLPFMEISSRWTGKRGVSLPFTDRCMPLVCDQSVLNDAITAIIQYGRRACWGFIELRDSQYFEKSVTPYRVFYEHQIDLKRPEGDLFSRFKDGNRGNIKKSLREGVRILIEDSFDSVKEFYRLNCLTRKRHGIPPQPMAFFKNLHRLAIAKGLGVVISAVHEQRVVSSSLFLHFGTTAVYKFNASDLRYQHLRSNNLVLWEAMRWYKQRGFEYLNLGRTDINNPGLVHFKRSWGASEDTLKYFRFDLGANIFLKERPIPSIYTKLFAHSPVLALRLFGKLAYKHFG